MTVLVIAVHTCLTFAALPVSNTRWIEEVIYENEYFSSENFRSIISGQRKSRLAYRNSKEGDFSSFVPLHDVQLDFDELLTSQSWQKWESRHGIYFKVHYKAICKVGNNSFIIFEKFPTVNLNVDFENNTIFWMPVIYFIPPLYLENFIVFSIQ